MAGFRLGIDEAGYGPTLGPLCVGCVKLAGQGLHVGPESTLEAPGAGVADSKLLHRGGHGLERLEAVALAAVQLARGERPASLMSLLESPPAEFDEHPWYAGQDLVLPVSAPGALVTQRRDALAGALDRHGLRIEAASVAVLLEGAFNRRLRALDNKSLVEQELIGRLLDDHLGESGPLVVRCDRLGGRRYYAPWLQSLHPLQPMAVLAESRATSSYRVLRPRGPVHYHFLVGGEERAFEIALASILAKYHRELMMVLFNRFWLREVPGVAPTAGYPQDARRFLGQVAGSGWASNDPDLLVRAR